MKTNLTLSLILLLALSACGPTEAQWSPPATEPAPTEAPVVLAPATEAPAVLATATESQVSLATPTSEAFGFLTLFERASTRDPVRYAYALDQGAQMLLSEDGRSFLLFWLPPGGDPNNPPPLIVSLHGEGAYAFDEFFAWHPRALEYGYGILAVQWRVGAGESDADYYTAGEVHQVLQSTLHMIKAQPGLNLLHGFGRGAASIYALAALDATSPSPYFRMTIANAGGANLDFSANQQISSGAFGSLPFLATHWFLYCGMQDPNPDRDGCPAMQRTQEWLTGLGGTVDSFIQDPSGGHDGFLTDPENIRAALSAFARIIQP
ncbi:MAG: hypothetical protein ABIJ39_12120 [Chloroflexota bacterium]